jgi:hypothetical protein
MKNAKKSRKVLNICIQCFYLKPIIFQAELASVTNIGVNNFIFKMTEGNKQPQGISIGAKQGPADFTEVFIWYKQKCLK